MSIASRFKGAPPWRASRITSFAVRTLRHLARAALAIADRLEPPIVVAQEPEPVTAIEVVDRDELAERYPEPLAEPQLEGVAAPAEETNAATSHDAGGPAPGEHSGVDAPFDASSKFNLVEVLDVALPENEDERELPSIAGRSFMAMVRPRRRGAAEPPPPPAEEMPASSHGESGPAPGGHRRAHRPLRLSQATTDVVSAARVFAALEMPLAEAASPSEPDDVSATVARTREGSAAVDIRMTAPESLPAAHAPVPTNTLADALRLAEKALAGRSIADVMREATAEMPLAEAVRVFELAITGRAIDGGSYGGYVGAIPETEPAASVRVSEALETPIASAPQPPAPTRTLLLPRADPAQVREREIRRLMMAMASSSGGHAHRQQLHRLGLTDAEIDARHRPMSAARAQAAHDS